MSPFFSFFSPLFLFSPPPFRIEKKRRKRKMFLSKGELEERLKKAEQDFPILKGLRALISVSEIITVKDKFLEELYSSLLKRRALVISDNLVIQGVSSSLMFYNGIIGLIGQFGLKINVKNLERSIKGGTIVEIYREYSKIERRIFFEYILKKEMLDYDKKKRLMMFLIDCLYSKGSSRRFIPFKDFWGLKGTQIFTPTGKLKKGIRSKMRELFRYFAYSTKNSDFIISSLADGKEEFPVSSVSFPIDNLLLKLDKDASLLVRFLKHLMNVNYGGRRSPFEQYSDKRTGPMNHIYLALFLIDGEVHTYIGKAKESTRHRWGIGTSHLHNVFHYIIKEGNYGKPSQLVDLITLYLGPNSQAILPLEIYINLKHGEQLDDYEMGYQYFFELNKDELGISGNFNKKLRKISKIDDLLTNEKGGKLSERDLKKAMLYKREYKRLEKTFLNISTTKISEKVDFGKIEY